LNTANVTRLAGAFTLLSQGSATLVLGVAPTNDLVRIAVAVAFFSAGTAPLARSEASKPAAVATAVVAVVWMAYIGTAFGGDGIIYEAPVLGIAGAALLLRSSWSQASKKA
jgi:hypothetical protein